jgi:hypothetical protein
MPHSGFDSRQFYFEPSLPGIYQHHQSLYLAPELLVEALCPLMARHQEAFHTLADGAFEFRLGRSDHIYMALISWPAPMAAHISSWPVIIFSWLTFMPGLLLFYGS